MKPKIAFFAIFILLLGLIGGAFFLIKNIKNQPAENISIIEIASAQEVYPLFECPCCGKAINECTCPMAKERMSFIDGLTAPGVSQDTAVLAYVKKYGLNSFMDKEKQKEFREKLAEQAPNNRPIISLNPDFYDFGDVSQKQGIVSTLFSIKNQGKSDLIINEIKTSCGCTSASIIYQGKEGPRFAMPGHGVNEKIKNWQISIKPGEEAKLKVYYDPNVHKDFRGSAIRTVSVFSNDSVDFEKEIKVELNQID